MNVVSRRRVKNHTNPRPRSGYRPESSTAISSSKFWANLETPCPPYQSQSDQTWHAWAEVGWYSESPFRPPTPIFPNFQDLIDERYESKANNPSASNVPSTNETDHASQRPETTTNGDSGADDKTQRVLNWLSPKSLWGQVPATLILISPWISGFSYIALSIGLISSCITRLFTGQWSLSLGYWFAVFALAINLRADEFLTAPRILLMTLGGISWWLLHDTLLPSSSIFLCLGLAFCLCTFGTTWLTNKLSYLSEYKVVKSQATYNPTSFNGKSDADEISPYEIAN